MKKLLLTILTAASMMSYAETYVTTMTSPGVLTPPEENCRLESVRAISGISTATLNVSVETTVPAGTRTLYHTQTVNDVEYPLAAVSPNIHDKVTVVSNGCALMFSSGIYMTGNGEWKYPTPSNTYPNYVEYSTPYDTFANQQGGLKFRAAYTRFSWRTNSVDYVSVSEPGSAWTNDVFSSTDEGEMYDQPTVRLDSVTNSTWTFSVYKITRIGMSTDNPFTRIEVEVSFTPDSRDRIGVYSTNGVWKAVANSYTASGIEASTNSVLPVVSRDATRFDIPVIWNSYATTVSVTRSYVYVTDYTTERFVPTRGDWLDVKFHLYPGANLHLQRYAGYSSLVGIDNSVKKTVLGPLEFFNYPWMIQDYRAYVYRPSVYTKDLFPSETLSLLGDQMAYSDNDMYVLIPYLQPVYSNVVERVCSMVVPKYTSAVSNVVNGVAGQGSDLKVSGTVFGPGRAMFIWTK